MSVDDRWLYVGCWGTGELKQYDVGDPFHPRETGSAQLGVGAAWLVLAVLRLAAVHQHAAHDVTFGHHRAQLTDVAVFAVLWTLMAIAMMLPTALVALPAGSHPHPGPVRLPPAIAANTTVWGPFGLALLAAI
jgi:predicted metal-binding membrane protein